MVNEINVRAALGQIESMDATPLRKARMLVRLARRMKPAAYVLELLSERYYQTGDPLRGARFGEAARRMLRAREDLRLRAAAYLRPEKSRMGFGYAPRERAYPRWNAEGERETSPPIGAEPPAVWNSSRRPEEQYELL